MRPELQHDVTRRPGQWVSATAWCDITSWTVTRGDSSWLLFLGTWKTDKSLNILVAWLGKWLNSLREESNFFEGKLSLWKQILAHTLYMWLYYGKQWVLSFKQIHPAGRNVMIREFSALLSVCSRLKNWNEKSESFKVFVSEENWKLNPVSHLFPLSLQ